MIRWKIAILSLLVPIQFNMAWSAEEHTEKAHAHGEEESDEVESSGNFGPDKGITAFDEHQGFTLSAEAEKHFELKLIKLTGSGPWTLTTKAIVHSGEEVNLYRRRDGFFKRIDFQVIKSSKDEVSFAARDLKTGDEIVIAGTGYLRVAELAATGGASQGHGH